MQVNDKNKRQINIRGKINKVTLLVVIIQIEIVHQQNNLRQWVLKITNEKSNKNRTRVQNNDRRKID